MVAGVPQNLVRFLSWSLAVSDFGEPACAEACVLCWRSLPRLVKREVCSLLIQSMECVCMVRTDSCAAAIFLGVLLYSYSYQYTTVRIY